MISTTCQATELVKPVFFLAAVLLRIAPFGRYPHATRVEPYPERTMAAINRGSRSGASPNGSWRSTHRPITKNPVPLGRSFGRQGVRLPPWETGGPSAFLITPGSQGALRWTAAVRCCVVGMQSSPMASTAPSRRADVQTYVFVRRLMLAFDRTLPLPGFVLALDEATDISSGVLPQPPLLGFSNSCLFSATEAEPARIRGLL